MIKKRNLDPSLIQWIMSQTGLGPGIGELHWVAPASSATSQYRTQLQRWGVEQNYVIHTTPAAAEAKMVASRNDVMLIMPGNYNCTAELDWDKTQTHMLGLGGRAGFVDYYMQGVVLYTATATVANVVHVTGNGCQFHNIAINNNAALAGASAALKVAGLDCRFYNSYFLGLMNTTQRGQISACSVLIASGSTDYYFEKCGVGNNCWTARTTAYQGHVWYGGTTESGASAGNGPQNGTWQDCTFLSNGTTAAVPMIRVGGSATQTPAGNEAMDRVHFFNNCTFDNWYGAGTTGLTSCFDDACLTWHEVRIKDCALHGYDQWRAARASQTATNLGLYRINMGLAVAGHGGESIEPTS